MAINIGNAAAAYARQLRNSGIQPLEGRGSDPAQNFADLLGSAVSSAISTGKQGEMMSARAIADTADLGEVVSAVTNAEITLQAAVAIRDRVIQAYQDIISMPI